MRSGKFLYIHDFSLHLVTFHHRYLHQLSLSLIFNKKTKARNYTLETINKKIYIFGIAMDKGERKEVIDEANKIYDVEEVIPSIYLAIELSRNKL